MKLPNGIQLKTWKTQTGTKTGYQVRIRTKNYRETKTFDNLQEATEFRNLSKTVKGRELIYSISEEDRIKRANQVTEYDNNNFEQITEYDIKNFALGYFADLYRKNYIDNLPQETELQKRNVKNKWSFLKTILNTSILDRTMTAEDKYSIGVESDTPTYRYMSGFDVRKLTKIDINNYIKTRLLKVQKISVVRELSFISNIFQKLSHFNEDLEKVRNVVLEYDKDLLKNALNTKEVSIQPKELERLWEGLSIYSNPEMYQICLISYMTSARRSEILTMKKNQVREFPVPHLIFPITKTKSRTVYIDKSTYEYIKSILPSDRDNLFTYSISGFGKVFYDEIRRLQIKLNDGRLINFHSFRKLAITNKLIELGKSNTIIASQYLGFASVKKLQAHADGIIEMPTTQHDLLKNIGHSSPQTTLQHYFSPQLKDQDISRIDELKMKKSQGNITQDEQNELLELLLEISQ